MSREWTLGSWTEITVPQVHMESILPEFDKAVDIVGGATVYEARGYYKRQDTGTLELEDVNVIRFDYNRVNEPLYVPAFTAIVKKLHSLGEESVLIRRHAANERFPFASQLIFK